MHLNGDITTLVALFAIVSPITSIPVFLSLTSGVSTKRRRIIALQTAFVSGLTLLIAYWVGDIILKLLSIQMEAFRIAGALVIGSIGFKLAGASLACLTRMTRTKTRRTLRRATFAVVLARAPIWW